jgi:3-oxoacyl-[acyl-carrier-protein] synthase-3
VTNDDLQRENPDWEMSRIEAKTGITARHVAADDETALDLGYVASRRLLDRALVPQDEIDYVIFATQTPDYRLPANACLLQNRLKLGNDLGALDVNVGCSGFVSGLQLAHSLVVSGAARNVLLVTSDTYSKLIHPRDRTVRSLFGDAAAATLIGVADGPGAGIGEFVMGTDGSGSAALQVPAGGCRKPHSPETAKAAEDPQGCVRSQDNLWMDGQAVFAFTLNTVPKTVSALLDKSSLTMEEVDWFVYHQANRFMLENLAKSSRIPPDKMMYHLETLGNTVASSIPLVIEAGVAEGRIQSGHRLMLLGFGVGFAWAGCLVTWP